MNSQIFSKLQNGFLSKKSKIVFTNNSKFLINFLNILINEGYIYGYKLLKNQKNIIVYLKYINNQATLNKIKFLSKKKKIYYLKKKNLLNLKNSLNLYIISTSKGLMTSKTAIKSNIGGKLICQIF
jgi:small subunit ribosomal protein S8